MSVDLITPLVYDTGALLAAERHDRHMNFLHYEAMQSNRRIIVPAPVLAQAWRGGSGKQVPLSLLLDGCDVEPTDEQIAKAAGVLLGASSTSDAVDAIVMATAIQYQAGVVTSDPTDLHKLADAANAMVSLVVV